MKSSTSRSHMHNPTKTNNNSMHGYTNIERHAQHKPNKVKMSTISSSSTHHSSNMAQHTEHAPNITIIISSMFSTKLTPTILFHDTIINFFFLAKVI